MPIKAIVKKASERNLKEKEVVTFLESQKMSLWEFAHVFSQDVADDYSFCDGVMNWLYCAFDAGEYIHSGDDEEVDPVAKYTDPAIERILNPKNAWQSARVSRIPCSKIRIA